MRRVRTAYEDGQVLLFQQRRAGHTEYLAVRVSLARWREVERLSYLASGAFGTRMKGRLEQFLSGQGLVA